MGCGTLFLHLALLVVTVRGQACEGPCMGYCGNTGLTREGNIVNIAFNKSAGMSSVFSDTHGLSGAACMLVNGNTSPLYRTPQDGNPNCVSTGAGDYTASWYVDLGRQYTITNITIHRRSENAENRMAGLSVLVENETTNQTCYSFPNSTDQSALNNLSVDTNITCDPPLIGSKVWLKKHGQDTDGAYYFINVCEVQVWGCREGYTGVDCRCRHCKDDASCDATITTCPNGCDRGWQENDYCDQPCQNGTYGDRCSDACGFCAARTVCDKVNGTCPRGCQPGFDPYDPLCKSNCVDGYYGNECKLKCSNCAGGAACDKVYGTCPSGCQSGFDPTDQRCTQSCRGGTFGKNCSGQCGLCKDDEECNVVTGHCSACRTNLLTPLCQVCHARLHGSSCDKLCSALCGGDGSCDKHSSTCVQGCVTGYVLNGSSVCEMCGAGLYGEGCGQRCGHCSGSPCRHDSGECESGCQDGYQGLGCTVSAVGVGIIAGAIGGGLLFMVVIAAAAFILIRKSRQRSKSKATDTKSASGEINITPSTAAVARTTPTIPTDDGNPYEIADEEEGRQITVKEENVYDPPQARDEDGAAYSPLHILPKKEEVFYQNQPNLA